MHGMLCFLLFAGALHVELEDLLANKWTICAMATLGVGISTVLVGALTYGLFQLFGFEVPLLICLIFGALISPTDPIAVLGLLKELRAPKELETNIVGESLFNDGVGVVVFFVLVSMAELGGSTEIGNTEMSVVSVAGLLFSEVVGGVLLGLGLGYTAYRALKSIDYHQLELLITLALVMFMYSLSFWLHVSGPIAVVVAGLFIGNHGKRIAMSSRTTEHVEIFWEMVDEILNAVLFLLIGLEVFALQFEEKTLFVALMVVPIVLMGRFISVAIPISALRRYRNYHRGIVTILTWGGLRGGISIALVLSLPSFPEKNLLLTVTYAVVLFSVLVQGLSLRRVFSYYGVGEPSS
jgi:CPA1 family monovalent cation:H+ antiporter